MFLSLGQKNFDKFLKSINFLKWMCLTKTLLKSFFISNIPWTSTCLILFDHYVTQRTVRFFQNLLCSWTVSVLLSQPQLVRKHFLLSSSKKQQDDMVQPFTHFRGSLKHQSTDYYFWRETYNLTKIPVSHTYSVNVYVNLTTHVLPPFEPYLS